jgi:hypothetical protein
MNQEQILSSSTSVQNFILVYQDNFFKILSLASLEISTKESQQLAEIRGKEENEI